MKTDRICLKKQAVICLAMLVLFSCNKPSRDAEIKADITIKAKANINFAGVLFTVENGNVTLSGRCPTIKSREDVKQQLRTIHVINSIQDHVNIAPVVLGPSFTLKQQVDSVLSTYPGITATVSDSLITLMGKSKSTDLEKLLPSLVKLYPKVNTSRLTKGI